jgi:hypothetical protein
MNYERLRTTKQEETVVKYYVATLAVLALPSVAMAQNLAEREPTPWAALLCLVPLFALMAGLLVVLFLLIRRSGAMKQGDYMANAAKHIERANAHMDAQAEREMRIIELLESIELELKRSEGIKKV